MAYSLLTVFIPLFFFPYKLLYVAAFFISFFSFAPLGLFFTKQFGGYNGDCLGASQQISEILFYISILALWRFF
jgi:adenosylcobinamide-GDP ribazoletransferase